jgi:glycosyltransferase involved in cell wall biosynthesis
MTPVAEAVIPVHVMQLLHSLQHGGSERLARDLALRFDPTRVRSSVCAVDLDGPLRKDFAEAKIPIHLAGRRPGFDWRLVFKLHAMFRRMRVDIVQSHHLTQLIYGALAARLAGAAVIHVEHEYFTLRAETAQRRLRLLAPLCQRVVTVGDSVRDFLLNCVGLPASKVEVIANGVDVIRYDPAPRVSRRRLGLPLAGRLVGHVARLDPAKDQITLLRAFRQVGQAHPDARLVIVGDGPQRPTLEWCARDLGIAARVAFLGARDDVADLLPHLEVFALSSVKEGLPLVILEAMSCARPVVATTVGEVPHVVRHAITGLTVASRDPGRLAEAIVSILNRPEWGAEMGRRGRSTVAERFNLATTVRQYHALFETITSPTPARDPRRWLGRAVSRGRST